MNEPLADQRTLGEEIQDSLKRAPDVLDARKSTTAAARTREFTILSVLTGHTGETLTPEKIESIAQEITDEMNAGATSWAFQGK